MKRQIYLRNLRELIRKYGSDNVVYFDESGFKANTGRLDGWAKRGKKSMLMLRGGEKSEPTYSWISVVKNCWRHSYFKAHVPLN